MNPVGELHNVSSLQERKGHMISHAAQSSSTEVAPGVHRLTGGVANFYLVEQSGGLTLVDAGTPGDWTLFLRTLDALGRRLDDLEAVVLTHAHPDHVGFAERARREGPTSVWIHHHDATVAQGAKPGKSDAGFAKYLARTEFYRTMISLTRRKGAKIIPVVEVSTFADDEVLDVPGKPRVVHAPGHTPGNAALYFEDRLAVISGDTLITHNPLTGRTGPQIMPSGFNRDTLQAFDSLSALENLNAEIILPGHGAPWHGPISQAAQLARTAGPT
jgi:glyoxylase-like metal-dependent hydrolase (beta-lactamase superfamily II)